MSIAYPIILLSLKQTLVCRTSGQGHGDIREYVFLYLTPYLDRADIDFRTAKEDVANVTPADECSKEVESVDKA